jgi:DNA-binding NarL/FixJ family response regulator
VNTVVVTDEPAGAAALSFLLRDDERFDVVGHARSGPEVLPLVGEWGPQVVVLDLDAAEIDGLGCVREIVKYNPQVKVVVVSVSDDLRLAEEALSLGACGYVVRGIDGDDVCTAVWRAVTVLE